MAEDGTNVCISAIEAEWTPEGSVAALVERADNMMHGLMANRNTERYLFQNLRR